MDIKHVSKIFIKNVIYGNYMHAKHLLFFKSSLSATLLIDKYNKTFKTFSCNDY